jgi:spore germination cell wall hydrolase CwlJ-like protein
MESRRTRAFDSPTRLLPAAGLALGMVLAGQAPGAGVAAAQPADDPAACLALAVYWEAGGEGREGMSAVAWVVLNRRAHRDFPPTVCEVVYQGGTAPGCQFRFWCDGKSDEPRDADVWALALDVAAEALEGGSLDPTGGALFFHAAALGAAPWRVPRERTVQIGRHIYYR